MKKFLEWFFGMFLALSVIIWLPVGWALLAERLWYDGPIGVMAGAALLICIVVGLVYWADDDDEVKYKYKVQIGDKEFQCNTVSHKEDVESILLTMDWVDSRVAIGTNIIISDI